MRHPSNRGRGRAGLTLIELIWAVGLLSILLAAMSFAFVAGVKAWDTGFLQGAVKKEASFSLRIVSEELEQATQITAAAGESITFLSDLDGNGADETITYSWSGLAGADLVRTQGAAVRPLAHDVEDAQFRYYDANNILLSPPVTASSVRVVELTLQIKNKDETLQYMVKIRPRGI